jgi:hypothetical protein
MYAVPTHPANKFLICVNFIIQRDSKADKRQASRLEGFIATLQDNNKSDLISARDATDASQELLGWWECVVDGPQA